MYNYARVCVLDVVNYGTKFCQSKLGQRWTDVFWDQAVTVVHDQIPACDWFSEKKSRFSRL